ncbi:MAG: hypothetical protein JWQ96_3034 [Segetibacter sp.]|nr:hypothetical protein [Segetibacter sp.]
MDNDFERGSIIFLAEIVFLLFLQSKLKTEIVAQLVRASVCGTEGRGFETHRSP